MRTGDKLLIGILIILGVILFVKKCGAQSDPNVRVIPNTGLYTWQNYMAIPPGAATEALNVDFNRRFWGIMRRLGYVAITDSLLGTKPLYGLYGTTFRNGEKKLFAVSSQNSALTGLAELIVSSAYTYSLDTNGTAESVYPYVYPGETPFWTTWKNDVIMSTGRQSPVIYHNGYGRDLIIQAPGEPRIYPMDDTASTDYGLSGEYRYLIRIWRYPFTYSDTTPFRVGYLSHAVRGEGKIMMTNFTYFAHDNTFDTSDAHWDTVRVTVYRNNANLELYLDNVTHMYRVFDATMNLSALDTLKFIDSIPDDTLNTGWYTTEARPDYSQKGRNVDDSITGIRCGAPTYIGRNLPAGAPNKDSCLPTDDDAICVIYALAYRDTITGFQSDTGRNLYIFYDNNDTNFNIGIPPIPAGRDHLIRILYKGYGFTMTADTSAGNTVAGVDTVIRSWWTRDRAMGHERDYHHVETTFNLIYNIDTNISPFYELAIIVDSNVRNFVDTLEWDTLEKRNIYYLDLAPYNVKFMVPFGDRLWAAHGSRVVWSKLDSASRWSVFNDIALNLDDGDDITGIVPFRDHIKIFKNKSQFIIWDDGDGTFNRKWVVDGFGCIAPRSMVPYNNGLAYVSEHGVVYETGLIYKDRGSSFDIISLPIQNIIDAWTPDEKYELVGIIKDNKYRLSQPDKDTTLVYDFILKAWSIYSYSFKQATFYDTINSDNIRPAADMLFITGDDDLVYKADTTNDDNGTRFAAAWKSAPIGISCGNKIISRIGFWVDPDDVGGATTRGLEIRDMADTGAIYSTSFTFDKEYYLMNIPPVDLGQFFYIRLYQVGGLSSVLLPSINGMDIWFRDYGIPTIN